MRAICPKNTITIFSIFHQSCVYQQISLQARALLDTSELSLLMFLLGQYRGHQMAIRTLVTSLQNMFDSREKEGLFTEIDQLIFTEDIPVYNSLVFQSGQLFERFIESTNKNQERCAITEWFSLR